jgi:uncharacterized small protein (DUF1192 family)
MSCLSSSRIAQLKARLNKKTAQLDAANLLYDELLTDSTESYRFDSGEGSQQAKSKKLSDVQDQISILESEIDRLQAKLAGKGIVNMNMRR